MVDQDSALLHAFVLDGRGGARSISRTRLRAGVRDTQSVQRLGVRRVASCGMGVTPAVEHQRRVVGTIKRHHFADENDVVAPLVLVRGAALETRRTAAQQGYAACALIDFQPRKFIDAAFGKTGRQRLLIRRQDMHGPVLGGLEHRQFRLVAEAAE